MICNTGDLICDGKPIIKEEHSSEAYEPRMPEAIGWIKTRVLQNGLPTTTRVVSKTSTSTVLTNTTAQETSTSLVTQVPVPTTGNSTSDSPTGTNPPLAQTSTSLGSSNYNFSGLVSRYAYPSPPNLESMLTRLLQYILASPSNDICFIWDVRYSEVAICNELE